jgi:hypothetical protein
VRIPHEGADVSALWIIIVIVGVLAVVVVGLNVAVRRKGYSIPGKTVLRCSKGHLFTTTWIEGGSLKAVRLGLLTRYQRCPVGKHWAIVHPVKDEDLTDDERRLAADVH